VLVQEHLDIIERLLCLGRATNREKDEAVGCTYIRTSSAERLIGPMIVHPRTWVQLQHRLRPAHLPLRSHQHTIIKQRIERSTSEKRRRGFHLVHFREERRDIRIASVRFGGGREVGGDVTIAVSI
jgi:hypothetical protein